MLRPLLYDFPTDPATSHLHDQAMFGPLVLLAPVCRPGRDYRAVYLPAGDWYDWWTDEVESGPAWVLAHAPLERMPLYVRAGAILPMGPDLRFTDEKPLDPLTLHLYPGEGTFTLYEDDGRSFAYERGVSCTTCYRLSSGNGHKLKFEAGERVGNYCPPDRRLILTVHAVDAQAAEDDPGAHYDAERRTLTVVCGNEVNYGRPWEAEFRI
ncbi:MAG: DUF5110 domain-containing protein [Chloroflexaceae bacterium]|nr:DUF5110 domain-containing protein [Chloroflexaceae bacterium]